MKERPMTNVKSILIDPYMQSVTFKEFPKPGLDYKEIKAFLDIPIIETISLGGLSDGRDIVLVFDEEGSLHFNYHFMLPGFKDWIAGPALILTVSREDELFRGLPETLANSWVSLKECVKTLRRRIQFLGNDQDIEREIKAGNLKPKSSSFVAFDRDGNPAERTELWSWSASPFDPAIDKQFVDRAKRFYDLTDKTVSELHDFTISLRGRG